LTGKIQKNGSSDLEEAQKLQVEINLLIQENKVLNDRVFQSTIISESIESLRLNQSLLEQFKA
jgi:hypothetical protein